MDSNQPRFFLAGRIVLLCLSVFLLSASLFSGSDFFTWFFLLALVALQGFYLIHLVNRLSFSEKNEEQTSQTSSRQWIADLQSLSDELQTGLNHIFRKSSEDKTSVDVRHQYLKTIVQHVGIGILTFDRNGDVQIINTAAKNLLGIKFLDNIKQLRSINEELTTTFRELKTGGRSLIKIIRNEAEDTQLAIYAIELSIQGQEFKLISLQNIQTELEEKEMEAWQNLIRVLTHEIMNSVTPISSLAKTLEGEIKEWLTQPEGYKDVKKDQVEDFHTALHTIHRRSENLIKFVGDFRNMTKITVPHFTRVSVAEMIQRVTVLLKYDIDNGKITVRTEITPPSLNANLDERQIEQVMINLVKNAIEALEEKEDEGEKCLTIKAWTRPEGGISISVHDNGPGVDEEAIKKIFIPFYTTKKSGSGIGLSLSKQIMRNHQGYIFVKSNPVEGTEFLLNFSGQVSSG